MFKGGGSVRFGSGLRSVQTVERHSADRGAGAQITGWAAAAAAAAASLRSTALRPVLGGRKGAAGGLGGSATDLPGQGAPGQRTLCRAKRTARR